MISQQDHHVDQGQHDVQVGDDHQLEQGVRVLPHDVLGQERLKAVAEKGACRRADGCRRQGKDGDQEKSQPLQRDPLQVGIAGRIGGPPPRWPQSDGQQHAGVEHERQTGQVRAMGNPVAAAVGKGHPAHAGEHVPGRHRHDDRPAHSALLVVGGAHRHPVEDEVHQRRDEWDGQRVVEHDDPAHAV